MSLPQQSAAKMVELHTLTSSFSRQSMPDAVSVLAVKSDLVYLYGLMAAEIAQKFGHKERAEISRRTKQSSVYFQERFNEAKRKAAKDAEHDAILAIKDELEEEARTGEEYVLYQNLLHALDRAISHAMQVVSYIGKESSPSYSCR